MAALLPPVGVHIALSKYTAKYPEAIWETYFFPAAKETFIQTKIPKKNPNAFLVIAEWKAHEIFKTWSGDFVLKHFNCQSRAVEPLSEPRDEQQLGGKWRREKKMKAQLFPQKTIARKRQSEIEGF